METYALQFLINEATGGNKTGPTNKYEIIALIYYEKHLGHERLKKHLESNLFQSTLTIQYIYWMKLHKQLNFLLQQYISVT